MSASDDLVAQFVSFTGAGPEEAQHYLEMTGGELQQAVNLFVDMGGGGSSGAAPGSPARPKPAPPAAPVPMEGVADADVAAEVAAAAAAAGIDLPDSSMGDAADDAVRAPIAAFQDQIINPDVERRRVQESIQADTVAMNRRMTFDRPVDAAGAGAGEEKMVEGSTGQPPAGGQAINQLFAPPAFNCGDPYYSVIEKAKTESKWVLVNIQQAEVFASHLLNRDVWSDDTITDIVTGSFMFWQRDDKSTEGVQFCQMHNCGHQLPHICVIDPRTGRRVKYWEGKKWVESHAAAEYLFGFLDQFSMRRSPEGSPMQSPQAEPSFNTGSDDMVMTGLPEAEAAPDAVMSSSGGTEEEPAAPAEPVSEMPAEPDDAPDCVKVSMRLPSGPPIRRRFRPDASLAEMFAVASAATSTPVSRVDVASTFPKRSLRDVASGMDALMKDAQVHNSQVMVTVRQA